MKEFEFIEEQWQTPNTYDINFRVPPDSPGVYLIVRWDLSTGEKEVVYVGRSKRLNQRYYGHPVLNIARQVYGYVRFYFQEAEDYVEREVALIKAIRPRFNTQFNK